MDRSRGRGKGGEQEQEWTPKMQAWVVYFLVDAEVVVSEVGYRKNYRHPSEEVGGETSRKACIRAWITFNLC